MSKIREFLKKIYYAMPRRIKDKEIYRANNEYNILLKLKKRYSRYIDTSIKTENKISNYVFTCWLQGEENAPELVKACFKSMRRHFVDKQLIIITKDNFKDWTDIPNYILDKWEKGVISNTHFSDLVRLELCARHGGLWIDSTVLCTGGLNKYIDKETDLFVFRNEHRRDNTCCLSNWFIYSKPNNPIIVNTRNLLYRYWHDNNKLIDYFVFHKIFTICAEKLKDEWDKVPFFTNIDPHVLWFYSFYEPYDEARFKQIKQMSNFHKLSYKFDKTKLKENSFYEHLIGDKYETD